MATGEQIIATYDYYDEYHRLKFGELADITCAYYNGDFSKSLTQAQLDKHAWILKGVNFKPGDHVLDIGSGWGPMLNAIKSSGGKELGLTLSQAQVEACHRLGLNARYADWKETIIKELDPIDAVVSVGAFEHFCSIEEFEQGQQEKIYQDFFKFCADALPIGGRLYLQTMTWGKSVPSPSKLSARAPEGSTERIIYRIVRFYPGSWLPSGLDQLVNCAKPHFRLVEQNSGRLDYIQTLDDWAKAAKKMLRNPLSWLRLATMLRHLFTDRDFITKIDSVIKGDQQQSFIKEIMDHRRIFFEKVSN